MTMKDLSGRLARWSLQLQGYDFSIEHRKGSENVVADTLSCIIEEVRIDPTGVLGFETTEFAAEDYTELVKDVESNREHLPDLKVDGGLIFKRMKNPKMDEELKGSEWKLWIPQSLTHSLVERAHSDPKAGHGGMTNTLEILRRQFYWPGMTIQVRAYVRGCEVCKESKAPNFRMQVGIGRRVETQRPFQKLYIDFLGKYPRSKSGHAWIFIVVDHFSKYTFLKAMKEATASNFVNFLVNEVFYKFGVPETIIQTTENSSYPRRLRR